MANYPQGEWLVDQDGEEAPFDADCDDDVYPGAPGVEGDGVVNDCDDLIVTWGEAVEEDDPGNDVPPALMTLSLHEGLTFEGVLQGYGWDPAQEVDHGVTCGSDEGTSEFQPVEQGAYTGDVEWFSLLVSESGRPCALVKLSPEGELLEGTAYDLRLYDLDDCDNPRTLHLDEEGLEIGVNLHRIPDGWGAATRAEAPLGVVLAALFYQAS